MVRTSEFKWGKKIRISWSRLTGIIQEVGPRISELSNAKHLKRKKTQLIFLPTNISDIRIPLIKSELIINLEQIPLISKALQRANLEILLEKLILFLLQEMSRTIKRHITLTLERRVFLRWPLPGHISLHNSADEKKSRRKNMNYTIYLFHTFIDKEKIFFHF